MTVYSTHLFVIIFQFYRPEVEFWFTRAPSSAGCQKQQQQPHEESGDADSYHDVTSGSPSLSNVNILCKTGINIIPISVIKHLC